MAYLPIEARDPMNQHSNPKSIHAPLGLYSHAVKVAPNAEWLVISGQVGINKNGKTAVGMARQTEQVFKNILACLKDNGMSKKDLVKVTGYITDARQVADYRDARTKVMGSDISPASTLLVVSGLASPDLLVEVEAIAAR